MAAATNPVIITGTTPVSLVRLIKAERTEFQCVLAVVAYEAVNETLKNIEEK